MNQVHRFFRYLLLNILVLITLSCEQPSTIGGDVETFVEEGLSLVSLRTVTLDGTGQKPGKIPSGSDTSFLIRLNNPKNVNVDWVLLDDNPDAWFTGGVHPLLTVLNKTTALLTVNPSLAAEAETFYFGLQLSSPTLNDREFPLQGFSVSCNSPPNPVVDLTGGRSTDTRGMIAFRLPQGATDININQYKVEITYTDLNSGTVRGRGVWIDVNSPVLLAAGKPADVLALLPDSEARNRYFRPNDAVTGFISTFDVRLMDEASLVSEYRYTASQQVNYTLTYNANCTLTSGSAPGQTTHAYGSIATVADDSAMVRTGYFFTGWVDSQSGVVYQPNDTILMTAGSRILNARWSDRAGINITFDVGGAGIQALLFSPPQTTVASGTSIAISTTNTNLSGITTGWRWYVNNVHSSPYNGPSYNFDTTTRAPGQYRITGMVSYNGTTFSGSVLVTVVAPPYVYYNGNGAVSGTLPADQGPFAIGDTPTVPAPVSTPLRPGFTFNGWNTLPGGGGTHYSVNDPLTLGTDSVTLYAEWQDVVPQPVILPGWTSPAPGTVTLFWKEPADVDLAAVLISGPGINMTVNAGEKTCTLTGLTDYQMLTVTLTTRDAAGNTGTAKTLHPQAHLDLPVILTAGGSEIPMVKVPVPAGGLQFVIRPLNDVPSQINETYYILQTEVTEKLWGTVSTWAASHGYSLSISSGGNLPAVNMTWREAMIWCNALTEYYNALHGTSLTCTYFTDQNYTIPYRNVNTTLGGPTVIDGDQNRPYVYAATSGNVSMSACTSTGFRLPTKIEWELAARYIGDFNSNGILESGEYYNGTHASGADTSFSYSTTNSDIDFNGKCLVTSDVANWNRSPNTLLTVKNRSPNRLGLYDMSGNVQELCFELSSSITSRFVMGAYYYSTSSQIGIGQDAISTNPAVRYPSNGFRIIIQDLP